MHFTVLLITAVFLIAYMLIAFINFIVAIAVMTSPDILPPSKLAYQDMLLQYMAQRSRTHKATGLLGAFSTSLTWPNGLRSYSAIKNRTSNLQYAARYQLEPSDGRVAATMLVAILIIGLLELLGVVWANFAGVTLAIFLAAILTRHISYVFGSLPERLRRSQYGPFRSFLMIAVFDALALTLCVTFLRSWGQPSQVRWPEVRVTALELFNTPHQVTDMARLTVLQIAIAMIGLLFYGAIIKSGSGRKQFHRTDEDIRALANLSVTAGDVTKARAWLKKEQGHNFESYRINARIALSAGDFSEAADSVRRSMRANGEDDSPDNINVTLFSLASLIQMSPSLVESLFRYLINTNVSDAIVSLALDNYPLLGNEPKELAKDLLEVCPEAAFPLTRSLLMVLLGDQGEAIAILGRATPGSEIEELMRLVLQCIFVLGDSDTTVEDTRSYLDEWFDGSFAVVKEAADGVGSVYRLAALSRLALLHEVFISFIEQYGPGEGDSKDESRGQLLLELAGQLADSDDELNRVRSFHVKSLASKKELQPASA